MTTASSSRSGDVRPGLLGGALVGGPSQGDQVQVSVEDAVAALDPDRWEIVVAEERPRAVAGAGIDAVIRARNDEADD